jgi:hypothetical protein
MENPIFENNPSLDYYFETSDGNSFFTEHAAQSHAQGLKNKQVKTVYKEVATQEAVVEASSPDEATQEAVVEASAPDKATQEEASEAIITELKTTSKK